MSSSTATSSAMMPDSSTNIVVQTSAFLNKLPAEVRVKIYRECFRGLRAFWGASSHRDCLIVERWLYEKENSALKSMVFPLTSNTSALVQVSRLLRYETLPVLRAYVTHVFIQDEIASFPKNQTLFNRCDILYVQFSACRLSELNLPLMTSIFHQLRSIHAMGLSKLYFRGRIPDSRATRYFYADGPIMWDNCFADLERHIRDLDMFNYLPSTSTALETVTAAFKVSLSLRVHIMFQVI